MIWYEGAAAHRRCNIMIDSFACERFELCVCVKEIHISIYLIARERERERERERSINVTQDKNTVKERNREIDSTLMWQHSPLSPSLN